MQDFVINSNAQSNGDHEVHNRSHGCPFMPDIEDQVDLGWHPNCHSAVAEARRLFPGKRVNGCYYCANQCHTT